MAIPYGMVACVRCQSLVRRSYHHKKQFCSPACKMQDYRERKSQQKFEDAFLEGKQLPPPRGNGGVTRPAPSTGNGKKRGAK